ncbi:hypothetical protein [Erwinia sp. 9145]|uniref:hypothetical protein n=1 Tax=Erwinia sp. 9145 TaxID=1500895 RepID=UPI0005563C34|nr:hypothetical protein [Erwinia sp. 9145]
MRKRIAINPDLNEGDGENLKQVVALIIPEIVDELTDSIFYYSSNAQYVPESIKIISIEEMQPARYKMTYSFSWRVFNACLDIDSDETMTDKVNFERFPGAIVFEFPGDEPESSAKAQ